jgi:hypothetical protein
MFAIAYTWVPSLKGIRFERAVKPPDSVSSLRGIGFI